MKSFSKIPLHRFNFSNFIFEVRAPDDGTVFQQGSNKDNENFR